GKGKKKSVGVAIAHLEKQSLGQGTTNYRLRDWLVSRQRYWGEPFPIVHLDSGEVVPVPFEDLPVALPHVDAYRPTEDGRPPLARAEEAWLRTEVGGAPGTRETNTMPQWAGSCWYYLRFMDPHNEALPFSQEAVNYWQNVDLYIGGAEHAVLHLLYARFWHKVLFDCGLVPTKEPFQRLFNQGMIQQYAYREESGKYHHPDDVVQKPGETATFKSAHDGESVQSDWYTKDGAPVQQTLGKMGKSLNNSVDPLDIVAEFGADTLRMYEMFMGPLEQAKPWQTSGCRGIRRFLSSVWRLFLDDDDAPKAFGESSPEVRRALHVAIQEATEGIDALKFNTPISKMMEFVNACKGTLPAETDCLDFLRILSPWAPHIAEELWQKLGHAGSIAYDVWPEVDESALALDEIEIAVQVNGKVRGKIKVPASADKDAILATAKADENVARHLEGKTLRREIVVPGRLVNLVVG
ncbi:MAG: class I tRNA ligase family protein, partial [Myxococcota bacterium]